MYRGKEGLFFLTISQTLSLVNCVIFFWIKQSYESKSPYAKWGVVPTSFGELADRGISCICDLLWSFIIPNKWNFELHKYLLVLLVSLAFYVTRLTYFAGTT